MYRVFPLHLRKLLRKFKNVLYKVLTRTNPLPETPIPEIFYFTSSTRKCTFIKNKKHHCKIET